jgi:hypothetical protein
MSFAYPVFLIALLAIAIPILIHLFYFRRYKKVYFSSVQWLQEAVKEQKKSGQLRERLILASRILAVTALVLAFAQPFLGKKSSAAFKNGATILYLDNSFSMGLELEGRPAFEMAKAAAINITQNTPGSQRLLLLTNNPEAIPPRWMSKDEMLRVIENVKLSPSGKNISEIERQAAAQFREAGYDDKMLYIISDFQKNMSDEALKGGNFESILIPVTAKASRNIYIDSCWMSEPVIFRQSVNKCVIRIRNSGDDNRENVQLTLKINGQVKGVGTVDIKANGTTTDTVQFSLNSAGWQKGEVFLQDYPVQFDDRYYFSFSTNAADKVLTVEEISSGRAIFKVFNSDAHFQVERLEMGNAMPQNLNEFSLVVLNELKTIPSSYHEKLLQYVSSGGSLYVIPGNSIDINSYNSLLSQMGAGQLSAKISTPEEAGSLNEQEVIVNAAFEKIPANIDLPLAKSYYPIRSDATARTFSVIRLQNGRPFLQKYIIENGAVYLQTTGLTAELSNFSSKAIFPPLLYNMAAFKAKPRPLSFETGANSMVEVVDEKQANERIYKMTNGTMEFIPSVKPMGTAVFLGIPSDLQEAGVYDIQSGSQNLGSAAINFNRKESQLSFNSSSDLKKIYDNEKVEVSTLQKALSKNNDLISGSTALWKLCLILGLIAILLEIILIRTKPKSTTA